VRLEGVGNTLHRLSSVLWMLNSKSALKKPLSSNVTEWLGMVSKKSLASGMRSVIGESLKA
jgi:hypothetical protein